MIEFNQSLWMATIDYGKAFDTIKHNNFGKPCRNKESIRLTLYAYKNYTMDNRIICNAIAKAFVSLCSEGRNKAIQLVLCGSLYFLRKRCAK